MSQTFTELSPPLQRLIDARLDNIERALMSTDSGRDERRQIVAAVEDQIQELISRIGSDDPTREDILKLLASIDPPEAYGWSSDDVPRETRPVPSLYRNTLPPANPNSDRRTNVLSIVAICLGGLSLAVLTTVYVGGIFSFLASFALCMPAFILGIIALCQIVGSSGRQVGIGLAITGVASLPTSLFVMAMLYVMLTE